MPPPPEEVNRFLNDPSPDAYEKLVERLLRGQREALVPFHEHAPASREERRLRQHEPGERLGGRGAVHFDASVGGVVEIAEGLGQDVAHRPRT